MVTLKGSMVQVNVHSVHNEAAYWKDPHLFRPERHLSVRREQLFVRSTLCLFQPVNDANLHELKETKTKAP